MQSQIIWTYCKHFFSHLDPIIPHCHSSSFDNMIIDGQEIELLELDDGHVILVPWILCYQLYWRVDRWQQSTWWEDLQTDSDPMVPMDNKRQVSHKAVVNEYRLTAARSCCFANAFIIFSDCFSRTPMNSALASEVSGLLPDAMSVSSWVTWPSGCRPLRIR